MWLILICGTSGPGASMNFAISYPSTLLLLVFSLPMGSGSFYIF